MAAVEAAAAAGGGGEREYGKQWYRRRSAGQEARGKWRSFEGVYRAEKRSVLGLFYWWMCMHEFCIEWAQKPPQILREYLPDRQASLPRATAEGEHREYPQSPARRGRLQNGRSATRQCLHGASVF